MDRFARPALFGLSLLLASASLAFGQPGFGTKTELPIGSLPREVHLADLDGDGHLDLVAACEGESSVGIFMGHGDGTFAPRAELPTADGPRAIAVTDWNGDGKPDLLVYANGQLRISSFLGVGDGTFTPGPYVDVAAPATRLVPADLDGDGITDLACPTDAGVTRLFTLKGLAGGGFGARTDLDSLGGSQAYDVAIGQFDGAGPPDLFLPLVCACPSHLLFAQPGGGYAAPVSVAGSQRYRRALTLDFAGDGNPGIVVCDAGPGSPNGQGGIRILENDGTGNFSVGPFISTGRGTTALALGPWGGASEQDVVVANSLISTLSIARVLCDGAVAPVFETPVGAVPLDVAIGDLDEDGVADIVTANQGAGTATLIHMLPNPSPLPCAPFAQVTPSTLAFGSRVQNVTNVLTVHVKNVGSTGFSVTSANVTGSTDFQVIPPGFPLSVAPGATVDIDVQYRRFTLGSASGTLAIHTSDPVHSEFGLAMTGTALPAQPILQAASSLDFGANYVGTAQNKTLTLSNVGSQVLTVSAASVDDAEFAFLTSLPFAIQPGFTQVVTVQYKRLHRGAAAGTLRLSSNDPDHPVTDVGLTGDALNPTPQVTLSGSTLDFGLAFQNVAQSRSIDIRNTGVAPLHVTGMTFSGSSEFTLVGAPTATIAPGGVTTRDIRYLRATVGDASGTFHVASDDSLTPDATVALSGSASQPPAITASAPGRPTLAAGGSTTVQVVVRNAGPGALVFTPGAVGTDLVESSPFDVAALPPPILRQDAGGAAWDVRGDGTIGQGTTGEYSGALRLGGFPFAGLAQLGLGGREIRLGPAPIGGGLVATRKAYVPANGTFVRYADVFENPADFSISATENLLDSVAFFPNGNAASSSGNGSFTVNDSWVAFPVDATPGRRAPGRVSWIAGAPHHPSASLYSQTFSGVRLNLNYSLNVPAHGRVVVLSYATQGTDLTAASATCAALAGGAPAASQELAAIDRAALWNAPPAAAVFRTAGTQVTLAAGDSFVVDVTCDASAATLSAAIDGTLRIASNDPLHPVLSVPVGFDVTGGAVVGTPPPAVPDAPPLRLALAGLVPNPSSDGAGARVALTLASGARATLTAYDVRGRVVATRVLDHPAAGPTTLTLEGRLPPGVVWLRLEQDGVVATRKGVVLP